MIFSSVNHQKNVYHDLNVIKFDNKSPTNTLNDHYMGINK